MVNDLIDLMIKEGMEINNPQSTIESLTECVANGHIRALYKFQTPIGFFTWREIRKNGKLYIWINFMCVKRQFRDKSNLLALRKFFRREYPFCEFFYWKYDKHGRFFYSK